MKHFASFCLTLLAIIFSVTTLSAQTACLIDSTITYDENDNPVYKTEYSYDAQGRINGTTTYRWENNVLIGDSKTFTVFDGSGRHITDVNYLWDATRNRWIGADSTVTVYTGSNITEKTIYAWDTATDNWIGQTRYTYTYFNNNANKKTLSLEEHWSTTANNWEGYAKTETAYDNAGRTTDNASYTWDGTAWAGTGTRTTYAYNTSGYEIEKITCSWSNGNWVNATKAVTAYDGTSTRKTETANYTWSNNDWAGTGTRTITEYDNARETLKTTYTWSNGNWVNATKAVTAYDGTSTRKTETANYTWSNSAWVGTGTRTTYEYDNARETLKTTYSWSNGNWVNATKAVTAYDGTSTRKTETANYTWSNNAWVGTGTRTTYEYSNGREILKTTYSWSNGDWGYATKAVTAYDGTSTRKTEIANYTWDNTLNDWKGQGTRTTTTYYTNGLAEYTAQYTWQNNQWTGTTRTYKEYNASKVAILEIKYNWSAGVWIYGTKTTHTYNGSLIAEDATYNYTNSEWVLQEQTLYTYSGSTQITKITCKYVNNVWTRYSGDSAYNGVVDGVTISATYIWDRNNTCWNGKTKTETTYYSGTIIAERITYEWKNSQWTYKSRVATEYDSRFTSKKTLDESYNWSNGMWVTNYKYINQYDDEGHTILEEQYKWDNTNQVEVGFSKTEREYGDNYTTTRSYSWKNGGWVGTTGQTKTKDANGRDIEILDITYYNDQWNNDRKREYVYDNNGHTLVENTYIWMTVVWAYSSRSEKTYDDDAEGKLREELTASYTNGAVQSFSRVTYFYHNDPHYIYQTEEDDICDEALPYTWHGKTLAEAGQLIDTVPGTDIFDTIIKLTLAVNYRTYGTESATIRESELPYIWHNKSLTQAGEVNDTLVNAVGCDSIITFTLNVLPTTYGTDAKTVCNSELPYSWHNRALTDATVFNDTIDNIAGGDSVITCTFTVNQVTYGTESATIRETQLPHIWHNKSLTQAGEVNDTLVNAVGCDSIITFTLNILLTTYGTDAKTVCNSELPYIWRNKSLTGATVFNDTIDNIAGGDSVITCTFSVNQVTYGAEDATVRETQLPYHWNGMDCSTQGEHVYNTTNAAGCDSIVTLTLNILLTTYGTDAKTVCNSELPYIWHNKSLTGATVFNDTIDNIAGGDSVITCTFSVNQVTYGAENATVRETQLPYHWNGMDCSTQGEHVYNTTNAAGCDSIVTLTLNILPTTYGTDAKTVCNSELPYIWHNKSLTGAAVFNDTIDNIAGGDSVITCTFSVNQVTYGAESATISDLQLPYMWHSQSCTQAGEYQDIIPNAAGCDSIITFTLTVIPLAKVDEYVPPISLCQGETFISRSGKAHIITSVSLWNDTIRHYKSSAEVIDSIYHYVASPYVLSTPVLDTSGLTPKCNQYLDIANLTSNVLEYIYSTDGSAPLIEPVTQAVEWQIHYEDEDWREWLNLPLADNKSTLSLRVIIHTICGDATSVGIDLPIECSITAIQDAVVSIDPMQPAYTPLGQLINDLDSYTGIVIQNGHKFFK